MKNPILIPVSALVCLLALSACTHVEVESDVASGTVLEDAILITSPAGGIPREAKILGDVTFAGTTLSFSYDLDATNSTHWWIIGHIGGEVAFTSNTALAGVDLYAVEPYDIASPLDWNIPANLDAFVNETTYSLDWWAQTVNNHSSHVAADTTSATLWQFGTTATSLGSVTVQLHVSN